MSDFYGHPDDPRYHGPDSEPRCRGYRYRTHEDDLCAAGAAQNAVEGWARWQAELAAINAEMGGE